MKKAKSDIKREPSAVTIGNLERELNNAHVRINDLVEARDRYLQLANERERRISELSNELAMVNNFRHANVCRLEETQAKLASTEQEYAGYRRAVADMKP